MVAPYYSPTATNSKSRLNPDLFNSSRFKVRAPAVGSSLSASTLARHRLPRNNVSRPRPINIRNNRQGFALRPLMSWGPYIAFLVIISVLFSGFLLRFAPEYARLWVQYLLHIRQFTTNPSFTPTPRATPNNVQFPASIVMESFVGSVGLTTPQTPNSSPHFCHTTTPSPHTEYPTFEKVDDMIRAALHYEHQSRDGFALRDFALGARIIPELTSHVPRLTNKRKKSLQFLGWALEADFQSRVGNMPNMALNDLVDENSCWRFPGSHGYIGIALKSRISINQLSIDHLSRAVASDIGVLEAPRRVILWGRSDGPQNQSREEQYRRYLTSKGLSKGVLNSRFWKDFIPLVEFEYKLLGLSRLTVQTKQTSQFLQALQMDFEVVVLEILNNWGASETCLYRVSVHGNMLNELSVV